MQEVRECKSGEELLDGKWQMVPGFEVDDNQHTNKESSPENTGPSDDTINVTFIL